VKRSAILFVAVNYGTAEMAMRLAGAFRELPSAGGDLCLAFVDNSDGRDQGELERRLGSSQPSVRCWTAPGNLGYFGGARYGVKLALEAGADPDWIVVSNVDLSFDPQAVKSALACHDGRTTGVVAPAIQSSISGRALNPFMVQRPSAWKMHAYKYVFYPYWGLVGFTFLSDGMVWLRRLIEPRRDDRDGPQNIYAPHGAFIAISRELFSRSAPLDHPPFLFGEEITLAECARRQGLSVVYDPRIRVVHHEHASTATMPNRKRHAYVRDAAAYCADTFFCWKT
jgi:GT2 family glycosyltransferase